MGLGGGVEMTQVGATPQFPISHVKKKEKKMFKKYRLIVNGS